MVAGQRRPAEYWQEVIEDFLKSGVSQKKYEQDHKICRATLLAWSKRLGIPLSERKKAPEKKREPKGDTNSSLSFIEVQPLGRSMVSPLLKIEMTFPQGPALKLETTGAWEEVGRLIRTLVG